MVSQGISEEVKEHTDWVNSYVIVEKDTGNTHAPNHSVKKKLRICLDPRDLNEALEREAYHTRSVDEITAKLQGMTVFTIVDFKKGYWMVVLHPDSRKKAYLHGFAIWQIPVDPSSHGYSCGTGHFPVQTGCYLYRYEWCHRDC